MQIKDSLISHQQNTKSKHNSKWLLSLESTPKPNIRPKTQTGNRHCTNLKTILSWKTVPEGIFFNKDSFTNVKPLKLSSKSSKHKSTNSTNKWISTRPNTYHKSTCLKTNLLSKSRKNIHNSKSLPDNCNNSKTQ